MSTPAGTRGTEYEIVVERGKIAEFAAAMQSQNPAYAGPDAIVPPTFLTSGALWAPEGARVDVGFDRRRLLHGEQEYVFHGPPPRAGQTLTAVDAIVDRAEGRRVLMQVGEKAEAREYGPLTTRMFVRYAGASGDFNPMHYDDTLARSAGYPSVFSQGMHSAALLASFAVDWLGAESIRRFGVRFREQVWPGDVLTCSGEITAISPNERGLLITAELAATRQTGGIAVGATADFLLPSLPLT